MAGFSTENRKPALPEAVARQLRPQLLRRAKLPGRQTLTPGRFHKGHLVIQEEDFLGRAPRLPDEGLVDGRLRLAAAHLIGQDEGPERLEEIPKALLKIIEVQSIGVGQQKQGKAGRQALYQLRHALHGVEEIAPEIAESGVGESHPEMGRDPLIKLPGGDAAGIVARFQAGFKHLGIDLLGAQSGQGGQAPAEAEVIHPDEDIAQVKGDGGDFGAGRVFHSKILRLTIILT